MLRGFLLYSGKYYVIPSTMQYIHDSMTNVKVMLNSIE